MSLLSHSPLQCLTQANRLKEEKGRRRERREAKERKKRRKEKKRLRQLKERQAEKGTSYNIFGADIPSKDNDGADIPSKDNDGFLFIAPPGLPENWVEVVDVDEEEVLEVGTRVLSVRHLRKGYLFKYEKTPYRQYGTVVGVARPGVYWVRYDEGSVCVSTVLVLS